MMKKITPITAMKTLAAFLMVLPVVSQAQQPVASTSHEQNNSQQTRYIDDSLLTAKAKNNLLTAKENLKGLSVTTDNGVATLTGFVSTKEDKAAAEHLVSQIEGIKRVQNNIVIEDSEVTAKSYMHDSAITAEVKAKALADPDISSSGVNVVTKNGKVLLTGNIPTQAQQEALIKKIKEVEGVKEVINQTTIGK